MFIVSCSGPCIFPAFGNIFSCFLVALKPFSEIAFLKPKLHINIYQNSYRELINNVKPLKFCMLFVWFQEFIFLKMSPGIPMGMEFFRAESCHFKTKDSISNGLHGFDFITISCANKMQCWPALKCYILVEWAVYMC